RNRAADPPDPIPVDQNIRLDDPALVHEASIDQHSAHARGSLREIDPSTIRALEIRCRRGEARSRGDSRPLVRRGAPARAPTRRPGARTPPAQQNRGCRETEPRNGPRSTGLAEARPPRRWEPRAVRHESNLPREPSRLAAIGVETPKTPMQN